MSTEAKTFLQAPAAESPGRHSKPLRSAALLAAVFWVSVSGGSAAVSWQVDTGG